MASAKLCDLDTLRALIHTMQQSNGSMPRFLNRQDNVRFCPSFLLSLARSFLRFSFVPPFFALSCSFNGPIYPAFPDFVCVFWVQAGQTALFHALEAEEVGKAFGCIRVLIDAGFEPRGVFNESWHSDSRFSLVGCCGCVNRSEC